MEENKSYLEGLKFDPSLLNSPIAKFLTNYRYVLLLIIAITVAGLFSFLNLPRRLNPEVRIPIVSVSTSLPGASPQDVESLITAPIEDEIAGLEGVNTITSTSVENFSSVAVEFRSGIDPDEAKDDVQSAVDSVNDLPEEAQEPSVQKLDFENQPVWTFILTTGKDEATLMRFGQNLKEKLEDISTVKNVTITGIEEQEIQVLVRPNVQNEFGIDPLSISRQIQSSVKSQPAGSISSDSTNYSLTIDPTTTSVEDLRALPLNLNGQIVRLGDVATVTVRSKPNQQKAFWATNDVEPRRAITFSVFKADSANIDQAVEDVEEVTEESLSQYKNQFNLLTITNLAEEIDKQFDDLLISFRDTTILVIAVLFIFLGIRQALIVAFSIPLSFLVAFTVMQITGLTLNFLSLFSLILALGLLVDDAIVIVTAVTAYWRTRKFSPSQTGLLVFRDFLIPIWSTTITAVWAFLPILIATGIIGEFIKSISIVVSATLLASTAIAILVTLPTMMIFLKPQFPSRVKILLWFVVFASIFAFVIVTTINSPLLPVNLIATALLIAVSLIMRKELINSLNRFTNSNNSFRFLKHKAGQYAAHGVVNSEVFAKKYEKLINRVLSSRSARNKTLLVVIAFAIFSYALVPLGLVKNEFFPRTDQGAIYINVELPPGTSQQSTAEEATKLANELRGTKGINYVTAETGRSVSTQDFFGPSQNSSNLLITLVLPEENERDIASIELAQTIRDKYETYYRGRLSVVEVSGGPPAGADIQIQILGDESKTLNDYADNVVSYLETRANVSNVQKSIKPGSGKIVFVPDRIKLAQFQITEQEIGFQLRTYASGFTLDSSINLDGEEKDIVFRTSSALQSPETLGSLTINTPLGAQPLSALGTLEFRSTSTQITREDRMRTIAVTGAVSESSQIPTENKALEEFAQSLNLPEGYDWKTGGVNEENQESLNSIFQAMGIAFILIAATMVIQFGSFRKAFIVLLKIPLAISGVFIVFALTATPLSFPTVIGILALFGITVYQSMLIIDKINKNEKEGMNLKHAIADASASRVEPILFGTLTTCVGLLPITLSDPLWRGLGGAIIAGLLFSGALMLLFIPVVYYKFYEKEVA